MPLLKFQCDWCEVIYNYEANPDLIPEFYQEEDSLICGRCWKELNKATASA